jgi:hypothetical protein
LRYPNRVYQHDHPSLLSRAASGSLLNNDKSTLNKGWIIVFLLTLSNLSAEIKDFGLMIFISKALQYESGLDLSFGTEWSPLFIVLIGTFDNKKAMFLLYIKDFFLSA